MRSGEGARRAADGGLWAGHLVRLLTRAARSDHPRRELDGVNRHGAKSPGAPVHCVEADGDVKAREHEVSTKRSQARPSLSLRVGSCRMLRRRFSLVGSAGTQAYRYPLGDCIRREQRGIEATRSRDDHGRACIRGRSCRFEGADSAGTNRRASGSPVSAVLRLCVKSFACSSLVHGLHFNATRGARRDCARQSRAATHHSSI
jgi:hypothetical protein